MKLNKRYIALGAIACGLFSGLAAHADEFNKETKISFGEPVQIPGMVLAPGTYTFKLADPDDELSPVEVLDANQTKVYALLQTISAERAEPTGKTVVKFAETDAGDKPVLTQWFYPGDNTGFQFLYPSNEERQLHDAKVETVLAQPGTHAEMRAGE